jgi:hypothetical protein
MLLVLVNYGALAYYRDALSVRDYSAIPNPQNRVGYCMLSSMTFADKYLLAETTAHPPDFDIYSAVMSLPMDKRKLAEVRIAIGALKNRDKLRERAHGMSHAVAAACGYWEVKWPLGVTPLDINLKWNRFDSTFSNFVERIRGEPDAAERLWIELKKKSKKV